MDFEFQPVESIEKVPEQFRGLYQEDEGQFKVGENFKGVTEAVVGLNRSLKAARAEAKGKTQIDISPLSDYGQTPDEIKKSITEKITELQDQLAKGGDAKLNLEKIRKEMVEAHSKDLQKQQVRTDALQNQLYGLLVENNATNAVVDAKGVPELLMPFIKGQVKVIEEDGTFNVYVVDLQGDRRYSGITGQPMTIKELVMEMKANEKYGRLFESEAPTGGGMQPGSGKRTSTVQNEELSSTQKISRGLNNRGRNGQI
jgi:hypothetical protein